MGVFNDLGTGGGGGGREDSLSKVPMIRTGLAVLLEGILAKVEWQRPSFLWSLFLICLNPIFWNVMARLEYKTRLITAIAGGNRRLGCYGLAFAIFIMGIYRDYLYSDGPV